MRNIDFCAFARDSLNINYKFNQVFGHMLKDHVRGKAENPDCVVIFFHPYGGNGADTANRVAELLLPQLPNARIVCPDAKDPVPGDPVDGPWRQWFLVKDMIDNPNRGTAAYRAAAQAPFINAYIDAVMTRENVTPDRVIIAGFSQGASMAVFAALSRETPVAAVLSISGGAIDQIPDIRSRPPVVLLAGERENNNYSGIWQLPMAQARLNAAGVPNVTGIVKGVGHEISPQAMDSLATIAISAIPPRPQQSAPHAARPYRPTG